jgi:hypothetical protein
MGIGDRVKDIGNYVRKRWRSTDPGSYDQYKRGREYDRKQAEQRREDEVRHGEQDRAEAERRREYEERYGAERKAEESRTEGSGGDTSHPE